MEYAQQRPSLMKYMPDQCDWLHLDKRWICDVMMSLDKDGISQMIMEAKQKRRQKLDEKSNLIISMRPEFADALKNSLYFSGKQNKQTFILLVHKGRSAYLMKPSSQRKRRTKDIEEVKIEEKALKSSKQKYLEENKRIKKDFISMKNQIDELQDYNFVIQLHQAGIINEDGLVRNDNLNMLNNQIGL